MLNNKRLTVIFCLLVFIASLVIYTLTLTPTVYLEDSGELIAAAHSLGVAHPSGYPLYVILGKIFSLLPFGNVAYNINLMSAFFGALTCAILFLVIQQINRTIKQGNNKSINQENTKSQNHKNNLNYSDHSASIRIVGSGFILYYIIPLSASLILAFSYTFWSQSVIAEVYTLNSFFVVLIILLLLKWSRRFESNPKYLILSSFLFGLSIANHQMMILLGPAFLVFVLLVDRKIIFNYKIIILALVFFLLGISVNAFMLLRTHFGHPDFVWGNPSNWENFKNHLLRRQYNDFAGDSQSLFDSNKLLYINSLFSSCLAEFTVLGVGLSVLGFIYLWFKNKKTSTLILLSFLFSSLLIIFLRKAFYNPIGDSIFQVYYLPVFIMLAICLGLGFAALLDLASRTMRGNHMLQNIIYSFLLIIFLLLPISYTINNYQSNDKSDFWLMDDYSKSILYSLAPDSLLLVISDNPAWDSLAFSIMYQQVVNHIRPDVKIVNVSTIKGYNLYVPSSDLASQANWSQLDNHQSKIRLAELLWQYNQINAPIYTLFPLGYGIQDDLATRSNGWVNRIYPSIEEAKADDQSYQDIKFNPISNLEDSRLINNLFYRDLLGDFYYNRANFYLEQDESKLYGQYFIKAIEYDVNAMSSNYNLSIQHRSLWDS